MADFCKQCSLDIFNVDAGDLAWGKWEGYENQPYFTEEGKPYWTACLCEDCGNAACLPDGTCISINCSKKHGEGHPHGVTWSD